MTTRILRQPEDIDRLARLLAVQKLPCTVTITTGAKRSDAQNHLAQRWFTDAARQTGETHDEVRAYCKLRFGVPILCAENPAMRLSYDNALGHLSYEGKLDFIAKFDLPVTRLMTVKQMTQFMDVVQRHYAQAGIRLTDPEALRYESEFAA